MGMEFLLGTEMSWPFVLGLTLIPGIIQVTDFGSAPKVTTFKRISLFFR